VAIIDLQIENRLEIFCLQLTDNRAEGRGLGGWVCARPSIVVCAGRNTCVVEPLPVMSEEVVSVRGALSRLDEGELDTLAC
jgi:hypothetical protein